MKNYKKITGASLIAIASVFLIAFTVFGWTGPSQAPPNGNVPGVIDQSTTSQYKEGALGIGGVFETDVDTHLGISGGNVGIGTTNPQSILDISGDLEFDGDTGASSRKIYFNSNTNHGSDAGFLLYQDNSSYITSGDEESRVTLGVYNDHTSNHADSLDLQGMEKMTFNVGVWDSELDSLIGSVTEGTTSGFDFRVHNSSKMVIDNSGNVGIGTTNPANILDVAGQVHIRGNNDSGKAGNTVAIDLAIDDNDSGINASADGTLDFWTNSDQQVRITSGGNVGIGTTNPTEKLSVNGDILVDRNDDGSYYTSKKIPWASTGDGNVVLLLGRTSVPDQEVNITLKGVTRDGVSRDPHHYIQVNFQSNSSSSVRASLFQLGKEYSGGSPELVTVDYDGSTWMAISFTSWTAEHVYLSGYVNSSDGIQTILSSNATNITKYDGDHIFNVQANTTLLESEVGIGANTTNNELEINPEGTTEGALPTWIETSESQGITFRAGNNNAFLGLKNRDGGTESNEWNTALYFGDDNTDHLEFYTEDGGLDYYFVPGGNAYADDGWNTFSPYISVHFAKEDKNNYEIGDVIAVSDEEALKTSVKYDQKVVGVISPKKGFISLPESLHGELMSENSSKTVEDFNVVYVAYLGNVDVKVNDEGGEIESGDLIVPSSVPGVGMKGNISNFKEYSSVIGKARESFTGEKGKISVSLGVK